MKTFLLDTNVLLHDPNCLKVFEDNEIIIPLAVLDELDNHKTRLGETARNAREVIRILDSLRAQGSLSKGVKYGNTTVRVELNHSGFTPEGLDKSMPDNRIISVALGFVKEGKTVIVVSKDINLRVKCDALGIKCEDYTTDKLMQQPDKIFSGVDTIMVDSEVINGLYANGEVELENSYFPNQFVILKSITNPSHSAVVRCVSGKKCKVFNSFKKDVYGIRPRNTEQEMALSLLLDPNIKLVTLIGKAGSGKTLLSLAAAMNLVVNDARSNFSRILVSRPIQPMGKEIGHLPGSLSEKLDPWMQPIYDNLELLVNGEKYIIDDFKEEGVIQVEALTYIRGRSIPNSFFIVDEVQNTNLTEIKTIITRMGEGSKIILTGDVEQIDNPYVDFADNGLTHIVERFKEHDIAGHITLRQGERSALASLAADIL